MKKIFLALACFGMLLATAACGGEMKKEVTVNKEILGDGAMLFQELVGVEETGATLSVVSDESGAISRQDFTVEVPVKINPEGVAEIVAEFDKIFPELTLTVFDKTGKDVPGLKDFKFDKECLKNFSETGEGVLVFKTVNNAKNEYKERFELSTSVQITVKAGESSGGTKTSSESMDSSYDVSPYDNLADRNPADRNSADMNPDDMMPGEMSPADEAPAEGVTAY